MIFQGWGSTPPFPETTLQPPSGLIYTQRVFRKAQDDMYKKLETATQSGSRLDQLKTLAHELAVSIDLACLTEKNIQYAASLAKQYRETIAEIEAIEGTETTDDEISEILQERADDGKSGAVRKNRTGLQAD